jgi:hypothetical protein
MRPLSIQERFQARPAYPHGLADLSRYITYYITAGDTRVNAGQRRRRINAITTRDSQRR